MTEKLKSLTLKISEATHYKLKMFSVKHKMTLSQAITHLVDNSEKDEAKKIQAIKSLDDRRKK